MTDKGSLEYNTSESWLTARKFAYLLGEVPNSFSSTIRSALIDFEKEGKLSDGSRFLMIRLLKSASIRAPLLFATQTYQEEMVDGVPYIAPESFLEIYTPSELSAFVGLMYMFRRAKKLSPAEEWQFISSPAQLCVEIGGHTGYAIPPIGPVAGILSSGLRYVGLATFMIKDRKGFVDYRRSLKAKGVRFDEEAEMKRWGCTNVQIAAVILQSLGFGVELADAMTRGLSPDTRGTAALDKASYRFSISEVWVDSLIRTGKVPDITHRGEFYPSKAAVVKLTAKAEEIQRGGCKYGWLERGKEDMTPQLTPQLFTEKELIAAGALADPTEAVEESAEIEELLQE